MQSCARIKMSLSTKLNEFRNRILLQAEDSLEMAVVQWTEVDRYLNSVSYPSCSPLCSMLSTLILKY